MSDVPRITRYCYECKKEITRGPVACAFCDLAEPENIQFWCTDCIPEYLHLFNDNLDKEKQNNVISKPTT